MPLMKETVINWWNKTFKNEVIANGGWFSNVTVYNLIINGVTLGPVLLVVAAVVVFLLYYKNTVNVPPSIALDVPAPADETDETDVCIYVPQPPNANPRRHRELRSELDSIRTYIEETSPLKMSGLRFELTDKHPNGSMPAKICVIFCDGIDHAEQSCLNMEKIQAEVVIVIMSYGPKRTAKILIDGGIKFVRWFKVDTSTVNLEKVVKDYIVPLLKELGKQERNVSRGSSFDVLSEYTGNGHFPHEDENNATEDKGRSARKSKKNLFINLKEDTQSKVKISLKDDRSIWGFEQHRLGKLRYHSSDPNTLEEFKRVLEKSQRDSDDDLVISVENNNQQGKNPFDRCRALALYICMNIAEDDSSMFPGGVYRIAASGGPDRCTKEKFSSENEKVLASGIRMLVWIDEASKIFSSANEFEEWRKRISAPATFIFTSTDGDFATNQRFLDDLKELEIKVKVLKAPLVMGAPPNIISSAHFESYEGVIKFLPPPDDSSSAQRPSDDTVARVLRDKTIEFADSLPEHIGIFQDDDGSWIVVVRISVASQLKRIFTSIYNQGAENMVNEALTTAWIDAERVERANIAVKKRLLRFVLYRLADSLLVSVLSIAAFFILKQLINKMFFMYLQDDSFVNYHCVALASIFAYAVFVKYRKEPPFAVNTEDPLPEADLVSSNMTTTNFFTINLQDAVDMYEVGVLCIDTMTPEQTRIIEQASNSCKIHVAGVAGTGKTFIGMYFVLKFLREQEGKKEAEKKKILYVCPTLTLGYYFANWLLSRMQLNDAEDENKFLESIVFLVGVSDEHMYRMTVLEDDSLDVKPKKRAEDVDFSTMNIGMVIIDEAHEKFAKKKTRSLELWNESDPRATGDFAGVPVSKALHGILTRLDEEDGKQECKAILLSDISQGTATEDRVVFPKNYEKFHLDEVTRCSKTIMLASKHFLPDNGRKISCAHDTDGNMVISNLFDIPEGMGEAQTYKNKVREEIERIREEDSFRGMELHMRLAVITPNEETLNNHKYLSELLEDIGLERISAVDAMKCRRRRRKNKGSCGESLKEKVMVDTVSEVKGLEFLFVILVDMDRPVSDGDPELNKETQSWFFSGISRSHCHVSVVNKNIPGGFLNWLHSTQAAEKEGDVSITDEDEKIDSTAITKLVIPSEPEEISSDDESWFDDSSDNSISDHDSGSNSAPVPATTYNTTKSSIWNNVDSSANTDYRLENTRFNPLAAAPFLENDGDLNKLCRRKEWEKVRNYVRFSSDSDDVKKARLMWKDDDGWNCLHWACRYYGAPVETVLMMIGIGGMSLVVATANGGWTPLHIACGYGASLEMIEALVDFGIGVDEE